MKILIVMVPILKPESHLLLLVADNVRGNINDF